MARLIENIILSLNILITINGCFEKKKHLREIRKCLIFNVDQPGLEPGTSRL